MGVFRFQEEKQPERLMITKKAMQRIIKNKDSEILRVQHDVKEMTHLAEELGEDVVKLKKLQLKANRLWWVTITVGPILGFILGRISG